MRSWELLAAMILAAACSVKEDRAFCPAWCVVYSDGYVADGCRGELTCNVATDAKSSFEYGKQDFMRFARRGDLVLEVPRGEQVYVDVFCGVKGMERNGSVLTIPMGFCCDSIYAGHGSVFISGEEGETSLPLNKDFAVISMKVKGDIPSEDYPFTFRIIGEVDGYVLPGGAPHAGRFDYRPVEVEDNIYNVTVPRQKDDSLVLEVYHKDDGSLLTRQPLGEIIRKKGYDWTVPDLPDIGIGIDMSEAGFLVEVEAWKLSETVTIIL